MDVPAPPNNDQQRNNGSRLAVGTIFTVPFGNLIRDDGGGLPYSIQDLRQAMSDNATLTDLSISFDSFAPTHDGHVLLQFLLQYIASRNHLRKFSLLYLNNPGWYNERVPRRERVPPDVLHQFVMAAVQSQTINHLRLRTPWVDLCLPFQALVDICHVNCNIKVLEMEHVTVDSNNGDEFPEFTPTTTLDKLVLDYVDFRDLPPFPKCTELVLGFVFCREKPMMMIRRWVESLVQPTVTRLTLRYSCRFDAFRAALVNGKACVEALTVEIISWRSAKFDLLADTMPDKLKVLHVNFAEPRQPLPHKEKKRFLQAVDACTTLEEIQVTDAGNNGTFNQQEMRLLREGRIGRNDELRRFEANPSNLSGQDLLKLMLRLENCPTGLYKLVRKLPSAGLFPGQKKAVRSDTCSSEGEAPATLAKQNTTQDEYDS